MSKKKKLNRNSISVYLNYLWEQVIVPNVIWTALLGIPSALLYLYGIYKTINTYITTQNIPTALAVITFASLLVNLGILIIGILYLIYRSRRQNNAPRFPNLDFTYRIISAECEFFFETRENITQRQKYHIEVLDEKLQEIVHNLQWTGQEYVNSELYPIEGYNEEVSLIDTDRTCSPYPVTIKFENTLLRGDTKKYSFCTHVKDISHSMFPFVGKIIKCQTDRLVLRITAPKGLIKNPTFKISTDTLQDILLDEPIPLSAELVGNLETFTHEVPKAELLRFYSLSWEF